MASPRKLMLLDPEQRLLKEFQTATERLVSESKDLMDSVPKLPSEEGFDKLMDDGETAEYILSAEELLDCMVVIQQQMKDLKSTYGHMKKYVEGVCIGTQTPNIMSKDAIGFLSSRTQFDQRIFKEQNPDMYQNYIKQTAPFLVVKKRKV